MKQVNICYNMNLYDLYGEKTYNFLYDLDFSTKQLNSCYNMNLYNLYGLKKTHAGILHDTTEKAMSFQI